MNTVLNPRCNVCGNSLRDVARFCDACGSPTDQRPTTLERKQVTILFADVVKSMALAATLEPERLRDIMYQLLNRSAAVIVRYGGTVDKFTGDGLMAMFGAPVALEDHALRACIAAVQIQSIARSLAVEVRQGDNVELQLRIGLNSGEVIAGEMGSAPNSYTVSGHHVGMAQRMESAAAPGGILCSEPTVRLAGPSVSFGPIESVSVKGGSHPIPARRLRGVQSDHLVLGRDDGPLVGRDSELARLLSVVDSQQVNAVSIVGDAGVGKSRLIREVTSVVQKLGAQTVTTRCESHAEHVPLQALSRVLRGMFGLRGLDTLTARGRVAQRLASTPGIQRADRQLVLNLLSISDPSALAPAVSADSRRARLIEVMVKVANAGPGRTLFMVEDLHWIDAASEEVLAVFAQMLLPRHALLICTSRPGHDGPLHHTARASVVLSPLGPTATATLAAALVGEHPTTSTIADRVAEASGGNPFFVEEIVRDLVDRGVLEGSRGKYRLVGRSASVVVPNTVQAVIAARIDRLRPAEKSVLNAGSVIGSAFTVDEVRALLPDTDAATLDSLVSTELLDQVQFLPLPRYRFRHPLVRTVCYESQLRSTRASLHHQFALSLQERNGEEIEQDAALIAKHFEAAEELDEAYSWYMRAGAWLHQRDVGAARDSWQRASVIADLLPVDEDGTERRIAPRAQLSFSAWAVGGDDEEEQRFDELRALTAKSGDRAPLALGMAGRVYSLITNQGRAHDAALLAVELDELYGTIDASTAERAEVLTAITLAEYVTGKFDKALQTIKRLRDIGEGLTAYDQASVMGMSGVIKVMSGHRSEGLHDLEVARRLGLESDPVSFAGAVAYWVDLVVFGFELVDDAMMTETERALRLAEDYGDGSGFAAYGLSVARWAHGTAVLNRESARRSEALELLRLSREVDGYVDVGPVDAQIAAARRLEGDVDDELIDSLGARVTAELDAGDFVHFGFGAAELVKLLIARGRSQDLKTAEGIVTRIETEMYALSQPALELWPLHCRILLAEATLDTTDRTAALARYRHVAEMLDARGHCVTAEQFS
jgi:adenylate cyclase